MNKLVPKLKNCCFCVPLKCSTIVFGILYMMASVPLLFVYGTPFVLHLVFGPEVPLEDPTLFFYFIMLTTLILQDLAGIFLVIAAFRKTPSWMRPWIYVSSCQIACILFLAVVCSLIYIIQVTNQTIPDDSEEATWYAVYAGYGFLLYYAICVVNSYMNELHEEKERAKIQQTELAPLSSV